MIYAGGADTSRFQEQVRRQEEKEAEEKLYKEMVLVSECCHSEPRKLTIEIGGVDRDYSDEDAGYCDSCGEQCIYIYIDRKEWENE